jgi:hypothetical protein
MLTRIAVPLGLVVVTVTGFATTRMSPPAGPSPFAVTVHEWGTFTSVAGTDGRAIDWLPLGGPTDLPCFVEHYQNNQLVKVTGSDHPVDYAQARTALRAKVRMETPVLYFYSQRDASADVRVRFPRGVMTEWYPHAAVTEAIVSTETVRDPRQAAVIQWPNVKIAPSGTAAFPVDAGQSHYYAARETDAAPLTVNTQAERFLFYRGVASFDVPLAAVPRTDGGVRVSNLESDDLPAVVLFARRGNALGYRIHGPIHDSATIDAPALSGSLEGLRSDLEHLLTQAGLYPREAKAMVETWRDSWFEEGTRVLYIVPRREVDALLPLDITPAPAKTVRVFVGRMEVVMPDMEQAVEHAVTSGDAATLERYGRFLEPIGDRLLARTHDPAVATRLHAATNAAFASYVKRSVACE